MTEGLSEEIGVLEDETDYYLGPVLGRGPLGFVYEGFRRTDGLDVAIKVVSKKLIRNSKIFERIKEDVACAAFAEVRNKHVSRTLGMVEIEGRHAIVSQHAPGIPLSNILEENGPLTDRRALKLGLQIVEGLIAALRRNLHHGDIRPNKLYVDGRGRLWITDFGLSFASCVASRFRKYAKIPFGHPEYLAPEVVQNGLTHPTEQADLYAVGITLYELVCGTSPFRGLSAKDALRGHLENRIPPPPRGIEVSEGMADLILSLTCKDPENRMPSLVSCMRAIKSQLTGKDPMECSITVEDWAEVSGRYAVPVIGWDADKIKADDRSQYSEEAEVPDEMLPPGEFMSGTGFFKPHLSGVAFVDPFDEARRQSFGKRIAAQFKNRIENVNISGKDIILTLSLILNFALIALILTYGLNLRLSSTSSNTDSEQNQNQDDAIDPPPEQPKTDKPKKGWKRPQKPKNTGFQAPKKPAGKSSKAQLEADRALRDRVTVLLRADPELARFDPKGVLVINQRIWFNMARLPIADAFTDREARKELKSKRKQLVQRASELIQSQISENKGIRHAPVSDSEELKWGHREALYLAIRSWMIPALKDETVRWRLNTLLIELSAKVRKSPDAYFLSVCYGALDKLDKSLYWMNEALLRGFRKVDKINDEPSLAGLLKQDGFWKLVNELGIEGINKPK